jgi:hypothetical protein
MKTFSSPINVPKPVARPLPDKAILWGSEQGGAERFPAAMHEIMQRRHAEDPVPMKAFGKAASMALDRVWIVDEYFFMPGKHKYFSVKETIDARIVRILDWLPSTLQANDVRILTKKHAEVGSGVLDLLAARAREINNTRTRGTIQCSIQIRDHLRKDADYIHDRFAIVDNELWHFGGTVGGFQASVSAASRGWNATELGASDFFEMAWDLGANQ